jgi:flagellar FliL protein
MSAPAAAPAAEAAPAPRKKGRKLIFIGVCLACAAAGGSFPMVVDVGHLMGKEKKEKPKVHDSEAAIVPVGDVVVNLAEERMQRYLKLKVALLVDPDKEADVTELVGKQKAALKSKLIGFLAGKSLKDVSGSVGVARLQREVLERVEEVLYPDGHGPIRAVLFEEYVVQ